MEVLREPPKPSSFIPLVEHQSATPASFYSGPPVLHYYSDRSKIIVLEHELERTPAFAPLLRNSTSGHVQSNDEGETNGHLTGAGNERVVEDVDIWVTSDKLLLFSPAAAAGISIPYPSISLHAIQSLPEPSAGEQQGLYMQLVSSSDDHGGEGGEGEDTESDSISVTIIPTASAPPLLSSLTTAVVTANEDGEDPIATGDLPEQTPVQALFTALSNCSNLHPDPVDPNDLDPDADEEGDGGRLFAAGLVQQGSTTGGLPPAMPGSGGWITAENMHEFVDEEGNWIGDEDEEVGGEGLGPGAGTVREREYEGGDMMERDEDGKGAEETKWRRTS